MQVTLNMAASLDGRVAGADGAPLELSGPEDWGRVHRLRAESDAILVGIGTVLADDPQLTARTDPAPPSQPLRVVLDSRLRTPPKARVLDESAATLLLIAQGAQGELPGAEVVACGSERVDPTAALELLAERDVASLLIEGGPTVASAFLAQGLVDTFHLYVAPLILGTGPSLWEALSGTRRELSLEHVSQLGPGVLLSYGVRG